MSRGSGDSTDLQPGQRPRYVELRVKQIRGKILLEVIKENELVIAGYEVRRDGERISPPGYDDRLRIIDKAGIRGRRELRMNTFYAELEPVEGGELPGDD